MVILIIIDNKVYRTKEKWPITVRLWSLLLRDTRDEYQVGCSLSAVELMYELIDVRNISILLDACFDEVETDVWDDFGRDAFSLDRLMGVERE
jgi:hypothetical protein